MKELTTENWISISNIVVPIIVSTICGIIQWKITSIRLNQNNVDNKINNIISLCTCLRKDSYEYYGKLSITPEYQQLLEYSIKSYFTDIKRDLNFLYNKLKNKKDIIHNLQVNDYIELNNIITGGSFETFQRKYDNDKCNNIIKFIDDFIKKLEELKK